jgi:hypothetical protein
VTTIHFGAYDPALLGVAENVDEFNERTVQQAIVFADTFEVFGALNPSLDEYAQALANVASHETAHLLGLIHTSDIHGIMDITASLRGLMADQVFSRSVLESGTFSLGYQDAAITLVESVGGDLELIREHADERLRVARLAKMTYGELLDDWPRRVFGACYCIGCETRRAKISLQQN